MAPLSYAGFYIDEWYAFNFGIWPTNWVKQSNTRFESVVLKSKASHQA